jgi:hypothetical protein
VTRTWECFDWLIEDRYHLRGNLRQVRTAIRRGWLEGPACAPQRAALGAVLGMLVRDPTTPFQAKITIFYICQEMDAKNDSRESAVRGDPLSGLV